MEDDQIHAHIEQPVAEEHGLRERGAQGGLSESERSWRESIMVGLDQYWDLLRQRRVLRESGDDPASPRVRELEIVERDAQLAMGRPLTTASLGWSLANISRSRAALQTALECMRLPGAL